MVAYATINDMQEISWKTSYILGNVYVGIGEIMGTGNCVDDMQMMQIVELQLMMSCGSHTKQSHKSITQIDHTRQDDITSKNRNVEQCFWMLQSNSRMYGGPETG